MSRYYNADEIDNFLKIVVKGNCNLCEKYERCNSHGINRKGSHLYCWELKMFPVAEIAEVVRCENCEFWIKQKDSAQGECLLSGNYPTGKWYCANGRRKEQ